MVPTMSTGIIILVVLFALLGGVANALLAWLNQKPRPLFDWGSFAAAFIVALGAAAAIAEGFNYAGITNNVLACIGAFLSGMGINSAVAHVSKAFAKNGFMLGHVHLKITGGRCQ